MAGKPTLEELLANVSQQYLNKPCKDEHLRNISCFISEWEYFATYLELTDTEVEDVSSFRSPKVQRIKLLETWKQHFGQNATYLRLAKAFFAAGRLDLVGKIQVECPHVEEGCKWTIELKDLKQHLNATPILGKELNGCEYAEVSCAHGCNRKIKRHSLQEHMKECSLRLFSCEYCSHSSTTKHQLELAEARQKSLRNDIAKLRRYGLMILATILIVLTAIIIKQQYHSSELHQQIQSLQNLQYQLHHAPALVSPSMCTADDPGLFFLTVDVTTELTVSVMNILGWAYSGKEVRITAELQSEGSITPVNVSRVEASKYRVTFTPRVRGWSKLHVKVNNSDIKGSPFSVLVSPEHPQEIGGLNQPWGIAINSHGEIFVTELYGDKVSVFGTNQQKLRTFGSTGTGDGKFMFPAGIDIDPDDNVYVASKLKLQKFNRNGKHVKSVDSKEIRGVKVHNEKVFVCDLDNHRILVYDLELMFIWQFGTRGTGEGEFDKPYDIAIDVIGNMYITDFGNHRVQVLNENGHFLRQFGEEKLSKPRGVHISGDYVYVSTKSKVIVFRTSGDYVAAIGEDILNQPCGITTDSNGIYVCGRDSDHCVAL